jgi:hypothetical protein
MARLASRRSSNDIADATEDVEAEVPAENIRHISDPSLGSGGGAEEAVDRATSSLGKPE